MKLRRFLGLLIAVVVLFGLSRSLFGWGFWAHKEVNRAAIDALPETLRGFFGAHADSIIENSIRPDLRRNSVDREQYYHYIDIDRYGKYPFPELPHDLAQAMEKFGADSVLKNGIVPWRIAELVDSLADAMREERVEEVQYYAADLGHYVADIHMPLHTTENYDGQLTDQKGVHWRFETEITERYGKEYDLQADGADGPFGAAYVENPLEYAFDVVLESYQFVDSVLEADGKARQGIPESELYTVVTRNGKKEYRYSAEYYDRFNGFLNGLAERRMRAAVERVASLWYSAWVEAGEPVLPID